MDKKQEHSSRKKILCIEDNEDACELYALFLPEYDFTFANSKAQALALVEEQEFDLYITDNWLLDGLGTDLCRDLHLRKPNIPIIFVSGIARNQEVAEALDAGANRYLKKPCEPDILQKAVKELLEKPKIIR